MAEVTSAAKRRLRVIVESYYDVLDQRIRTDHRVCNYSEHAGLVGAVGEIEAERLQSAGISDYRAAVRKHKADGKYLESYIKAGHELEDWHKEMDKVMSGQEAYLKRLAMREIKDHPLWTGWLSQVRGIGPCLAGGILAWIDPRRANHCGQLWRYCGLGVIIDDWRCPACSKTIPAQSEAGAVKPIDGVVKCPGCGNAMNPAGHAERRVRGEKTRFNPRAKVLAWKIGESFVKQSAEKSGYRRLYDQFRAKIDAQPCMKVHYDDKKKVIPCFDAHKFAQAKRAVVKIFLSHVYKTWRGILGLPVSDPYPFSFLGHDKAGYIEPVVDRE